MLSEILINVTEKDLIKTYIEEGLTKEEIKYCYRYVEYTKKEEFIYSIAEQAIDIKNIFINTLNLSKEEASVYVRSLLKYFYEKKMNEFDIFLLKKEIKQKFKQYRKEFASKKILESIVNNTDDFIKIFFNKKINKVPFLEKLIFKYIKEYNLDLKDIKILILLNFKIDPKIVKNIELKRNNNRKKFLIIEKTMDKEIIDKLKRKLNVDFIIYKKNI